MKYEIVYSKRGSLSITVSADNKVTLRCPIGYSRERADRFLSEKSAWINRTVARNEKRLVANSEIISYEKILINGVRFPLYIGCSIREITNNGVFVKSINDIKRLFTDAFAAIFIERLKEISRRTGLNFRSVQIKGYKSRWGCCDGANNLSFNYKLFMLPNHIQYYIIIHELCHTAQHNHSESFWRLVEKFAPDYRRVKKELRGYDFLTSLY